MVNNQLKLGALLNYILIVLNALIGILYTPYMLRMLGQSEYGLYSLVASVISYLTLMDLGLGNAVVRYTARFRAEGKTAEQYELFGMFFFIYLIIGLITLILGSALYDNIEQIFGETMSIIEIERAQTMVLILIINVSVTFPMSIFGSIMLAYEHFVFPRMLSIFRLILNTFVMIVLLHFGYKAVSMVITQTIFNFLTLLLNYFYCRKKLYIKLKFTNFNFPLLKEISIYSFWIFLNVIMDRIYWSTGQFVLGATVGTIAVSIYAIAIKLEGLYMNFSTAVTSVFLPKVTAMIAKNNNREVVSDLFIKTGRIQFLIMSFVLSIFFLLGKTFILLWAGKEYNESFYISLLFFISLFVPLMQNLGITILQARNQMKFRSVLYVVIAFISLGLQIVFSKLCGPIGCGIAVSIALFLGQGIIMNIYYYKKQGINIIKFWNQILHMSIAPILITLVFYYLQSIVNINSWSSFFPFVTFYSIIFFIVLWIFSMNQYEKNLILQPIKMILKK